MVINETHSFRGSIIMYGMIMLETPTLILMIVLWLTGHLGDDGPWVLLLVVGMMVLTFFILMNIRLEIRIDNKGISYRNPPFINSWRKINKEDIVSIRVKKLDGMFEYGGIGVRFSRKWTGYIYFTDHVLEVILPKKKLIFSIDKARDLNDLLERWNEKTNTNYT